MSFGKKGINYSFCFLVFVLSQTCEAQVDHFFYDRSFYIEDCAKQNGSRLVNCVTPPHETTCGVSGANFSDNLICGDVITIRRYPDPDSEDEKHAVLGLWKNNYKKTHLFFGEILQRPTEKEPLLFCYQDDWDSSSRDLKILAIKAIRMEESITQKKCRKHLKNLRGWVQKERSKAICRKSNVVLWEIYSVDSCSITQAAGPPDDGQGTGSGSGF